MVTRAAIALLLLLPAAFARAAEQPSLSVLPDHSLAVSMPEGILDLDAVKRQLASGLTATFLTVAEQPGTKLRRSVRTEIRWDLWDEVWIVRRVDADGRADAQRLPRRALAKWWTAPARLLPPMDHGALRIELTVLPFSAAEEADARSWIGKSGGLANNAGSGIVEAMIGSTIAAQPITAMSWRVRVPLQ